MTEQEQEVWRARGTLIVGLGIIAFSAALWSAAGGLPRTALSDPVGPGGLPKLFAALLAVLSVVLVAQSLAALHKGRRLHWHPGKVYLARFLRSVGILALAGAYAFFLDVIGFPLSVCLLLLAVSIFTGQHISFGAIVFSLVGGMVFHLVFVWLLGVNMPVGLLFSTLG
jgi:putative tricarboxylic transport membrane protein